VEREAIAMRSYWVPASYAPTVSESRSAFLRPLKNKGCKEGWVAKVGMDDLDTSTTLESNKSLKSWCKCERTGMAEDLLPRALMGARWPHSASHPLGNRTNRLCGMPKPAGKQGHARRGAVCPSTPSPDQTSRPCHASGNGARSPVKSRLGRVLNRMA
jgi:hypothetical protein